MADDDPPRVKDPEHVSTARAVCDASAAVYEQSVGTELTAAFEGPIDRALLAAFVEILGDVGAKRVLAHTAHLLVAFQAGNGEGVQRSDAYGTGLRLTNYRHSSDDVARRMTADGFQVQAQAVRDPELQHESTPQAFILARPAVSIAK